jgi:hypothetical protein
LEQRFDKDHYLYRSREVAYKELKHYTNQDFGYDVDAWRQWFKETNDPLPNFYKPFSDEDETS